MSLKFLCYSLNLAILLSLISLYIYGLLRVLQRNRHLQSPKRQAELDKLEIPNSGAERHQALKSDPLMLEKIKQAAKIKVQRPRSSLIEQYLAGSDLAEPKQRYLFVALALALLLSFLAIAFLSTAGKSLMLILACANFAVFFAGLVSIGLIKTKTQDLSDKINFEVSIFIDQLIMAIMSAEPIDIALAKIWEVSALRGRPGPILKLIKQSLNKSQDRSSFIAALRAAASHYRQQHLYEALTVLIQLDQGRASVVQHLQQIREAAEKDLSLSPLPHRNFPLFPRRAYLNFFQFTPNLWARLTTLAIFSALLILQLELSAADTLGVGLCALIIVFYWINSELKAQLAALKKDFFMFLQLFRKHIKLGRDTLTSLKEAKTCLSEETILPQEVNHMFELIKQNVSEEQAIAAFGLELPLNEVHIFVQGILLNRMYPTRIGHFLDHTLLRMQRHKKRPQYAWSDDV